MKRLALPLIGALICLQFTAGCLDTGRSKSGVRVAKGSMNGKTAKEAKRIAEQGAITEVDFNFTDDDAYRNYIDPVVSNLKVNDNDSIGFEKAVKARKWTVLSLYNKTAPADVFFIARVKATSDKNDPNMATLAWVSPTKLQLDKSTYESYLKADQGSILMRILMTIMRLETKGQLAAYAAQAQIVSNEVPSEVATALSQELQDGSADDAEKVKTETQVTDSEDSSGDGDIASAVPNKNRRPMPVDKCNEETGNPDLPECVKKQDDVNEKKRNALLDKVDKENIEKAADYMLQHGRNGKIEDIKAKLKELTIIK